jgi:hypothetical protein
VWCFDYDEGAINVERDGGQQRIHGFCALCLLAHIFYFANGSNRNKRGIIFLLSTLDGCRFGS